MKFKGRVIFARPLVKLMRRMNYLCSQNKSGLLSAAWPGVKMKQIKTKNEKKTNIVGVDTQLSSALSVLLGRKPT